MTPVLGVVADDLTGGLETAAILVAMGIECRFVTAPEVVPTSEGAPVIVVAQKTRVAPAADAVARSKAAAEALKAQNVRQIFFKYCGTFDSTDQGNIGPVADMLLDFTGAAYTAYCPATPAAPRTVYNGHMFLGAQLVSESHKRFDPLTPMLDSNLVRVLQRQTKAPVALLPYPIVAAGEGELRRRIGEATAQGARHFIADTVFDIDLATIARLTVDWPVMTGNSTILEHYPALWRNRGWLEGVQGPSGLPAVSGPGVVLSGSCAERTLAQLDHFERSRPVLRLDLLNVESVESTIQRALEWAHPLLQQGPVAIATSEPPDVVQAVQAKHGRDGAARLAEDILSGLALKFWQNGVRRIVVSGGETSGSVMAKLGIRSLRVGRYGGLGIGRATSDGGDPIAFCLKSGKLGPDDIFLSTLESMLQPETPNAL